MNLEKFRNELPTIKSDDSFLDMHEPNYFNLNKFINKKVWIRIKENDGVIEYVDKVINIDNNYIILENVTINYEDLIGIEDISNNYNNIDYKKYKNKKVRITNVYNNYIDCVIQDYLDDLIIFAVRLENYDSLSYDLEYPINLIKKIEII